MFNRKFSSNICLKRRMIRSTIILLVVCLGLGYSAFTTNLGINGTLNVSKYDHTLYGVLEKAVSKGYAQEYTGSHQDSMAGVGTKNIYHWYAENNTAGNNLADEIINNNNVIFANHCWQMIRTTDTGGVKMIYNGEPENNQCLSTRGSHVGYSARTTQSMSTTYYYGTSYAYDKTNNVFSLSGTVTTGAINTGQYTCKQTTSTGTCSTLYLVDTLNNGTTYYVLPLTKSSHYSQFGILQFNQNSNSPAYGSYMYNTTYSGRSDFPNKTEYMISPFSLSTSYWYADSITWNTTSNRYNLDNPYQVSSTSDYSNLVGKYTFGDTNKTYTNTSVYYITAVSGSLMYYIQFGNESGSTHDLNYYNHTYTYGDSYTNNGNGTYTINNPATINRSDWYTSYSNLSNKYICKNATNNTCNELWYGATPVVVSMLYYNSSDNYIYSKNYTWDGTKYSLDTSNMIQFWDRANTTNLVNINNNHYTCFNTTGECTTISYIYFRSGTSIFYINLSDGKSVNDALDEMLYNDNINSINSTMKTGIDAWYRRYMTTYTSKLEDTVFCNDRNISNLSGWNPNGGTITSELRFSNISSNSNLSCTNTTDKFSLSNNKAQLTYPVGLLTYPEINLLNNNKIRKSNRDYWIMSPYSYIYDRACELSIGSSGGINSSILNVNTVAGIRPVISLKPGTEYVSGTGSMADPYVVQ